MENNISLGQPSVAEEVLHGMGKDQKQLPSKLFYDERGSRLFEEITQTEEYYPTRTERAILDSNIGDIAEQAGSGVTLVELGSGSSRKTRLLLEKLPALQAYIPVDISESFLLKVVSQLRIEYPQINIIPVFADYTQSFNLPGYQGNGATQLIFFPGSTIGNFHPIQARAFLDNLASIMNGNAQMLIGVDLKKDRKTLEAAYNDTEGITARFNKNMLVRINRELNANFEVDQYGHHAFYNEAEGRIEMHLVSEREQQVTIEGERFELQEGESIHTENSYKYALDEFRELVDDWFSVEKVWTDEQELFSLQLLKKK